ncbi:PGPGW domain-containing protein [Nocardioides sp. 1609]|uniref:PGPGW domain-containing protein n=1 Tax=Nocardioides sp. 1609 TaxID=2508327 RepID=UPI00106F67C6|nr:PGPGW domain-containing protein [Nocardioides sp. 1609]
MEPSGLPDEVSTRVAGWPSFGGLLGRLAGWTLVVVGVVLMPLPGPGTLIVVAGLRILVPYHRWAAASYDRVRERAVAAARAGVATRLRVVVSLAGVVWITVLSGMYAVDVSIPRTSALGLTVGPSLPFHSTATAVGLVVSALASAGATLYSIARLRPRHGPPTT